MLVTTLALIPGYNFNFLQFLWRTLVLPILEYGFDVFDFGTRDFDDVCQMDLRIWRKLLKLGGRSPVVAIEVFRDAQSFDIDLRARRLGFLL
eukprot:1548306-Karenia_brevis.AAC.1